GQAFHRLWLQREDFFFHFQDRVFGFAFLDDFFQRGAGRHGPVGARRGFANAAFQFGVRAVGVADRAGDGADRFSELAAFFLFDYGFARGFGVFGDHVAFFRPRDAVGVQARPHGRVDLVQVGLEGVRGARFGGAHVRFDFSIAVFAFDHFFFLAF